MLYETKSLPKERDAVAPDGSDVRVLLQLEGLGSVAHFQLGPGQVSRAVTHKTVHEIWYVLSGAGQMWRSQDGHDEEEDLVPGVCLTLPLGTRFQFRALGDRPLEVLGVTMPPWPNTADEAILVQGVWESVLLTDASG